MLYSSDYVSVYQICKVAEAKGHRVLVTKIQNIRSTSDNDS